MKTINNNIQEGFVDFLNAKLLKEAGFDGGSNCYEGFQNNGEESYDLRLDIINNTGIYRPTLQLAIDWIRVNWGIHIEIHHIKTSDINRFHVIIWVYGEDDYKTIYHDGIGPGYKVWDTPDEAKQAAIKYVLENLILKNLKILQ